MHASSMRDEGAPHRVRVALDLETTGLSADGDAIIEIAAVKFRGPAILETFNTLVNPRRPLPLFVQSLTGITPDELRVAPTFESVAGRLEAFVGAHPVVGHNISFDLAFLQRAGLRPPGPQYDTIDLASVLLPELARLNLAGVAQALGLPHERPHRALSDAETAMTVFLSLVSLLRALPAPVRAEMRRIADRSDWPLRPLFQEVLGDAPYALEAGEPGLEGLDLPALAGRLRTDGAPETPAAGGALDAEAVAGILGEGGSLSRTLHRYEHRPEQARMAQAVAQTLDEGGRLIVEAGTGTGKSLAYLVPAALHACAQGRRVVISTNTINLQEQLVRKDIPDALRAIEAGGGPAAAGVRFAVLKGRANYLCLRRFAALKRSERLSAAEARLLAKVLVWLQRTATGDRGEIRLTAQEAPIWARLSAQEAGGDSGPCPLARRGLCFYQTARRRAESARLVVVNHALLAQDAARGGLLPDYQRLIIDEAHNLEEVATGQWGVSVDEDATDAFLDRVTGASGSAGAGLVAPLAALTRSALVSEGRRGDLLGLVQQVQDQAQGVRGAVTRLFRMLADFAGEHGEGGADYGATVRLTRAARVQPAWSGIETAWEDANIALEGMLRQLERMHGVAGRCADGELPDREGYLLDIEAARQRGAELRDALRSAIAAPDDAQVCWISIVPKDGSARLNAAPLHVGPALDSRLFSQKEAVVLTGATLSVEGNLQFIKERLQLGDAKELVLGSPFDYPRLALVYLPTDIPPPTSPGYHAALVGVIADAARAARGRTMALFTGWAALRAARTRLQEVLAPDGITVMAQGTDGSPQQLVDHFRRTPNVLLLGTGSFWEGVDIAGEALSVLIITRLPFSVPTDPVFAARSERFEDPFNEYGVPQAVLRFKQGFGRLIRRKTDRGVMVLLDRRVQSKGYGAAFLDSIPPCARKAAPARELGPEIVRWLSQAPLRPAR